MHHSKLQCENQMLIIMPQLFDSQVLHKRACVVQVVPHAAKQKEGGGTAENGCRILLRLLYESDQAPLLTGALSWSMLKLFCFIPAEPMHPGNRLSLSCWPGLTSPVHHE